MMDMSESSSLLEQYTRQRDLLRQRRNELRQQLQSQSKLQNKRPRIETVARTLDTYQYSKSLITKYSRLPEMDMDQRLRYARMTCPWMSVVSVKKERPSTTSTNRNTNSKTVLCQTIIHFDSYGDFTIDLMIDIDSERVESLTISPSPDAEDIDEQKSITGLIEMSMQTLDVSRFVYGMNTLLRMRHKRKRAWMSVVDELDLSKIRTINAFPVSPTHPKESLNRLLFEHSPSSVEFELPSAKILRINWYVRFLSGSRHCVSDFTASITVKGDSDAPSENITRLLKSLIRAHDIKVAVLQILNIL